MKRIALSATALAFAALLSAGCSKTDSSATTTTTAASGGGGAAAPSKLDAATCGKYATAWGGLLQSITTGGPSDSTLKQMDDIKAAVPSDVAKNIDTVETGIKGKSTTDAALFLSQDGSKPFASVTTWLTSSCATATK